MSGLGFKSVVYHGDVRLGELDTVPVSKENFQFPNNEIRIHHISARSERCAPLAILQTISPFAVRCKLESSSPVEQQNLIHLQASIYHECKTAVVLVGDEEIHLVAMPSKQKKFPCFWCYSVPKGLYDSSLGMFNMRCLSIVFDLDETLIVANTMKSFEDRIEALKSWMARDTDPMRIAGMSAELKRLSDDRMLLKQYIDSNCVVDNGKVFKVQMEEVPPPSDGHVRLIRPVIRLQERNLVLTRINPEIRDTSVLVRLRPAWEDLRNYLTARGRKRFEVYVCTMAERDYALEIWRLLDPESHLIGFKELPDRIVCVKSASRKSLLHVFRDGICHPKMAMVIDDRVKVWEEKDQPRVHVVPAFAPYYAPQAETANAVPVLFVARNVACNVRACFFKEFDEIILQRISGIFYEDDVANLPPSLDVSNYLITEDVGFAANGITNAPISEGMNGAEVERRLNQSGEKHVVDSSSTHVATSIPELKSESHPPVSIVPNIVGSASATATLNSQKPSFLGTSVRQDGSSGDSDYEMKTRVPNMKPSVDIRNQSSSQPLVLSREPAHPFSMSVQPQGGRLVGEDVKRVHLPNQKIQNPFFQNTVSSTSTTPSTIQVKAEEHMHLGLDTQKENLSRSCQVSEAGRSQNHVSTAGREFQAENGKVNGLSSHLYIGVLQEIGRRCGSKVEFRSVTSTSKDLLFSVEVLFTGEKIGVGMGKTRKDAQQQAADHALRSLAEKYVAYMTPLAGAMGKEKDEVSNGNENGFLWDSVDDGTESNEGPSADGLPKDNTSEPGETEQGSTSSASVNQHANSPRFRQSVSSKRMKEEP